MEPIEKTLEKDLHCNILLAEGLGAIGTKPRWNRDNCPYYTSCVMREYVKKHQKYSRPKPCLFNPKMFRCPAYQYYEMPLLLTEKND